jgi:hypothetical protein
MWSPKKSRALSKSCKTTGGVKFLRGRLVVMSASTSLPGVENFRYFWFSSGENFFICSAIPWTDDVMSFFTEDIAQIRLKSDSGPGPFVEVP